MGQSNSRLNIERGIKQNPAFIKMTDDIVTDITISDIDINSYKKWGNNNDIFPSDIHCLFLSSGADKAKNDKIKHLLDGYGHAIKAEIKDGKFSLVVKRIVDDVYVEEIKKNTIVKKGLYILKTKRNLFDFSMRNMFHQSIYFRNMYIGCTGGNWIYMNPDTCVVDPNYKLDEDYDGGCSLKQRCMHPLIDYKKNTLITFTFKYSLTLTGFKTVVTFYEFSEEKTVSKIKHTIDGMVYLHGFLYTDKYYILFNIPMRPNMIGYAFGKNAIMRNVDDKVSDNFMIYLIPRDGNPMKTHITLNTNDHGFVYHGINSYDEDNTIIIDVFLSQLNAERESSQFEVNDQYNVYCNNGEVCRYVINLDDNKVTKKGIANIVGSTIDFRTIGKDYNGVKYNYSFICSHDMETKTCSLYKIDMNKSEVADKFATLDTDHYWFRDPEFISRRGAVSEDDGYIFMWVYHIDIVKEVGLPNGKTELYIFNALNLSVGPQYVIDVTMLCGANKPLPYGLHSYLAVLN